MGVLWWLAPPLAATALAMVWASWRGRAREEPRREDADAELAKLGAALARPLPSAGVRAGVAAAHPDPSHGIAIRRTPRPDPESGGRR